MKGLAAIVVGSVFVSATVWASGCASHPPPQACEVPPPEKKEVEIGTCPIDAPPPKAASAKDAAPETD
jgi:hypothetical protein